MTNGKKLLTLSIIFLVILSFSVFAAKGIGKNIGETCKSKVDCKSGLECRQGITKSLSLTANKVCGYPKCSVGVAMHDKTGTRIKEGKEAKKTCECFYKDNPCVKGQYCMQAGVNSNVFECQTKAQAKKTFKDNVAFVKKEPKELFDDTGNTMDALVKSGTLASRAEADLYPSCPITGEVDATCSCKASAGRTEVCSRDQKCVAGDGCNPIYGVSGKGTHTSSGELLCSMLMEAGEDCICGFGTNKQETCVKGEMCKHIDGCVTPEYKRSSKSFGGECVSDNECKGDMSCMKLSVSTSTGIARKNICEYETCDEFGVTLGKKCSCDPRKPACDKGKVCYKDGKDYECITTARAEEILREESAAEGVLPKCSKKVELGADCICDFGSTPKTCLEGEMCVHAEGCTTPKYEKSSKGFGEECVSKNECKDGLDCMKATKKFSGEDKMTIKYICELPFCDIGLVAGNICGCGGTSCDPGEICAEEYKTITTIETKTVRQERCVSAEEYTKIEEDEEDAIEEEEEETGKTFPACVRGTPHNVTCLCDIGEKNKYYCSPGTVCTMSRGCLSADSEEAMTFKVGKKKPFVPKVPSDPKLAEKIKSCSGLECGSINVRLRGPGHKRTFISQGTAEKINPGEKYEVRFKANKNKVATKCLKIDGTTYADNEVIMKDVSLPDDSSKTFRAYAYADKECTVRLPKVSVSVKIFSGSGRGTVDDARVSGKIKAGDTTKTTLTENDIKEIDEELELLYDRLRFLRSEQDAGHIFTDDPSDKTDMIYELTFLRNRALELRSIVAGSVQ